MLRSITSLVMLVWSSQLSGAAVYDPNLPTIPHPSVSHSSKKLASNAKNFGVETQQRERPVKIEQDCPSPDLVDTVKTTSWNNLEGGVSFPLDSNAEARLYTRYTCMAPKTEPY